MHGNFLGNHICCDRSKGFGLSTGEGRDEADSSRGRPFHRHLQLWRYSAQTRLLEDVKQTPRLSDAAPRRAAWRVGRGGALVTSLFGKPHRSSGTLASPADEHSRCGRAAIRSGAIHGTHFPAQAGVSGRENGASTRALSPGMVLCDQGSFVSNAVGPGTLRPTAFR
jgi:hypothetical protein